MRCTIVSFFPIDIPGESKPGLYPGHFSIPKSDGYEPTILHVGNSIGYVYLDETRGSIRTTTPADEMANSIIEDWCNSISYSTPDARPGMFWVEGEYTAAQVMKQFADKCKEAMERQKRYFVQLVKIADDDYSKTKQLKSVSDLQRFASNFLNLEREWNIEAKIDSLERCPACASIIAKGIAICPQCTAILDEKKAAKFQFAGKV